MIFFDADHPSKKQNNNMTLSNVQKITSAENLRSRASTVEISKCGHDLHPL